MKKVIKYTLITLAILTFGILGFNLYYFNSLKPKNAKILEADFGKFYYSHDAVSQDSINTVINLLEKSFKLTDQVLNLEKEDNLKIMYCFGEKKISKAYPRKKIISFFHFNSIYPPYIHEYIHIRLGTFKEFWFKEGYATFLSLKIKDTYPELKYIYDLNDNWFIKIEGNPYIADIDDLRKKYNAKDIKKIISLDEKNPKFKTLGEQIEYYKISASFCEYLSDEIGFSKLIELVKTMPNRSIRSCLEDNDFNLELMFNNWLSENFE